MACVNATLHTAAGAAFAWWCLVVAIAAGRYLLARRFMAARPGATSATTWRRRYIGATAMIAAAWGAGTVLFMWQAPDGARLFTGLVLSGMVAGAVPILAPVPAAFRTFALLVSVPMSAVILLQANSALHWAFGAMTLIFLAAVLASARYLHETLDVSIRLGLEKGRLLDNLERARRAAEAALEASNLSLWNFDIEAGQVYLDENWVKIVGGDGGERVAAIVELARTIHPDDRERIARSVRDTLKGLIPAYCEEIRVQSAAGDWKWIACRGKVVERNAAGWALRATGTNIDITERKRAEEAQQTSEARFRLLASATFEGIAITEQGRFIDANDQLLRMLDYTREELIGHPVAALLPAEDRQRVMDNIQNGHESRIEHAMLRKDGSPVQVEAHGQSNDRGGRAIRITALRDITERKLAEQLLRIAATAFESQEGMVVTDADNTILRVNRAFTDITGYAAEEAVGRNTNLLKSGRHDAAFYAAMWESIQGTGSWQGEIWNRRKNGEVYPEWLTITAVKGDAGEITHYVATLTDITLRKAAEDEVKHLAFYDPLTRLPNRRLLLDRLQQALSSSKRSGCDGALLFIDLDNFKTLNDTFGHDIGDLLLQQVAERLAFCIRECDTVARLGGDEFVVMLEELSENAEEAATQTRSVGEKILSALKPPYLIAGHQHHSTSSIGATLFNDHQSSVDELMKRADLAMYQAKAAGRNTLRFFDPKMQAAVTARATLEADLRHGLQRNEFLLHYQAQVDDQGYVTGAEALVRWRHPRRGLVSPADFIPLAEDTGLILPLGHWVLAAACLQLVAWAARLETAHLTLAVNVSPRQFHHPGFVDLVLAELRQTGANPQKLKLELTESLLLDDVEDTIGKMTALKAKGVGFALDDFGTGYSSLTYLKRLPLDQLKIDQSFVRDLITDANDAAITRTIVALAHSMGLGVIAEGVETEEQRDFLIRQNCRAFQGYLFGRPRPIGEFEAFEKFGQRGVSLLPAESLLTTARSQTASALSSPPPIHP